MFWTLYYLQSSASCFWWKNQLFIYYIRKSDNLRIQIYQTILKAIHCVNLIPLESIMFQVSFNLHVTFTTGNFYIQHRTLQRNVALSYKFRKWTLSDRSWRIYQSLVYHGQHNKINNGRNWWHHWQNLKENIDASRPFQ